MISDKNQYIAEKWGVDLAQKPHIQVLGMNRASLARLFTRFGYRTGVEVGTLAGEYADVLCRSNPRMKLYCVDPYEAYVGYVRYHTQRNLDDSFKQAKKRLKRQNVEFIKEYSVEAAKQFERESVDFVYIDGAHDFRNVVDDIDSWYLKIKVGGIISGHDYIRRKRPTRTHIIQAVHGFRDSYSIKSPLFITDRPGHLKEKGRDQTRSWFWIKDKLDNEYLR